MLAAIIQARMGSNRLPGKTLTPLDGNPMLEILVGQLKQSLLLDELIIATTTESKDDDIVKFSQDRNIKHFRGSELDVLGRMYHAARQFGVEHIVRVTPDCPLLDPEVMDLIIRTYLAGRYDYVSNTLRYTYPDGLDVEVFSFLALERAWKESQTPSEREHVTTYIRTSGTFSTFGVENDIDLSHLKLSVDTMKDLDFVESIYGLLPGDRKTFRLSDVLQILRNHPELSEINDRSIINEGYYKSLASDPPEPARKLQLDNSTHLKLKAQDLIPSGTQTFSKGPTQLVQGASPAYLKRGQGSHVWDVDGNEYIDWVMALGPVILGYDYPPVSDAAKQQISDGVSLSLPHPLEVELSELMVQTIRCADMVRFGKNGSDATSGAVRLARAYTGKDIIACCGYHGWQDWYVGTTSRSNGVPTRVKELTIPFSYNDIESLESIFVANRGHVAAVIMEPIGVVEPVEEFLEQVRDLTLREGSLLIFDEVITGFRLALGGAQEHFGVIPDLACFGKALGNGFPISAVVGRREVMELFDEIFFSFTFGGEAVSLAAAAATIREIRDKNVIPHLWAQGQKLKDGYNVLAREYGIERYTECIGLPPHTVVVFKDDTGAESLNLKSLYQQECLKRGVLFSVGHNISYSHSDHDVDQTLKVHRACLEILSQAISEGDILERLEGKPVEPVFRQA